MSISVCSGLFKAELQASAQKDEDIAPRLYTLQGEEGAAGARKNRKMAPLKG